MKKKNIKPLVLSSLAALSLGSMSVAGTFALFTDKAETTVNIGSGIVDVRASLSSPTLYSASGSYTTGDVAGVITGDFAGTYYYEPQPGMSFANGGTATLEDNVLGLSKMTPGDKVAGSISFVNNSNIDIKYRFNIQTTSASDDILLSNMIVKVFGQEYAGLRSLKTAWTDLDAGAAIPGSSLEVILPLLAGNENQNKSIGYTFAIEAVQGNAMVDDDAYVNYVKAAVQPLAASDVDEQSKLTEQKVVKVAMPNATSTSEVITVTVPENAKLEQGATALTLFVENLGEDQEYANFDIEVDQGVENYDITLEGLDEDNTQPVTVTVNLGYQPIKVYHTHAGVTTSVDFDYDPATGLTTFQTVNFSDYSFVRETNIIEVQNVAKLKLVRDHVNAGNSLAGKTVKLMDNLDLSGEANWTRIGDSSAHAFAGTFDGNGKTISNLAMSSSSSTYGFIGYANGAMIKSVTFNNADVACAKVTGVILGEAKGSLSMKNVHVSGQVSGTEKVGGFIGQTNNCSEVIIEDCSSNVTVSATNRAGGYVGTVGYGDMDTNGDVTFKNCSFNGAIATTDYGSGGFVGHTLLLRWPSAIRFANCTSSSNSITATAQPNTASYYVGRADYYCEVLADNCLINGGAITSFNQVYRPSEGEGSYSTLTLFGLDGVIYDVRRPTLQDEFSVTPKAMHYSYDANNIRVYEIQNIENQIYTYDGFSSPMPVDSAIVLNMDLNMNHFKFVGAADGVLFHIHDWDHMKRIFSGEQNNFFAADGVTLHSGAQSDSRTYSWDSSINNGNGGWRMVAA